MSATFTLTQHGNELLDGDGFHLSFRAEPQDNVWNALGQAFGIEGRQGGETALYTEADDVWRILDGDFRSEYEQAFPDLDACIAVYDAHKADCRSGWSTDEEVAS